MTTLQITGINLENNTNVNFTLKASNTFTMMEKYLSVRGSLHIEKYNFENNNISFGNSGMNAGAYLCEFMSEETGINLA
jgi:hypothetical protein